MTQLCCKCREAIKETEKRVPIDTIRVMHLHCYGKHLCELEQRAAEKEARDASQN